MSEAHTHRPLHLIAPATAMVVVFMVLPLLYLFRLSLNRFSPTEFMVSAFSLENYATVLADPYYFAALKTTIVIGVLVTTVCVILGYPLARMLARSRGSAKQWLILALFLPLFVGNAVRAAGWMMVLGQEGLVNSLARLLSLAGAPWQMMYTPGAVVVGMIAVNLPFVTLTIQSVLEGIPASVEEAASSLGAPDHQVFSKVTLPLAMPGIMAAVLLSFILSMNAYATPVLLGGPSFRMMAPVIADEILQKSNMPFGATLAFILMTVTLILTLMITLWLGKAQARD